MNFWRRLKVEPLAKLMLRVQDNLTELKEVLKLLALQEM